MQPPLHEVSKFGGQGRCYVIMFWGPRKGGGGIPLDKLYRYAWRQRVRVLSRFGLKMDIDFNEFGLKV